MEKIFTLNELDEALCFLEENSKGVTCFAFHGEMGAGKTTFITAYGKKMGVISAMSSPTFSIINEYITESGNIFYHMDLYRLKNEEEAITAGVEDALYSGNICMVEWPEKAPKILPDSTMYCYLTIEPDGRRKLRLKL